MAEALVADIKDNILTCNICLGEYDDPRVLPCYHTFCNSCICDHATRTLTPNRTFLCPICREEIQFPAGGLHQLKKNFVFSKTKDIITKQQERQTLEEEQANVAAVAQAIEQMTISCKKHPDNELKYYCEDDKTVICGECIAKEHGGHRISSVMQVAKINRDKIKAALGRTMTTTNRFKEALETANKTDDHHIKTHTIKNIKKQAQNVRKFIDQREETLTSEVNSAYDNWKKQKEATKGILEFHHASLQSACDFAQELITNGTDSDIMVHAKSLIERLAVMEKTPVPTPDTPAQISYIPGKISTVGLEAMLGQVTEELKLPLPGQGTNPCSAPNLPVFFKKAKCVHSFCPRLKGDSISYLYGLAVDEQYIYVVDQYDSWLWNARTKLLTHNGEFKFDFKLNRPYDVAVSQTGYLYITSKYNQCVKVYSTRGQQVSTMGQGQLGCPCGITVNKQGHVMVCDMLKKSIFTFHADSGQLLNTIPLSMCRELEYITVNSMNDNIVISDSGEHSVHVLSPTGDQLYQYGTEVSGNDQLCGPCGVCTDSYGHIFIADYHNHRIVALSPQGQFIRYIATKDDGLEYPRALAINPAGQLVVAEVEGNVKTFQYL